MSARSELLFQARKMISNPILLSALVSKRARQLMTVGCGSRSTAEIVDYALNELLAGSLEFKMDPEKEPKSAVPPSRNHPNTASREVLEVEAR
jgi:DNA-directed RNA polymerase subunit K/omega